MKTSDIAPLAHTSPAITGRNLKVLAIIGNSHMNIYLRYPDGSNHYLMTRRWNPYLWSLLKNEGVYIDTLRRMHSKNRSRYDAVHYLLKVIDSYFQYDMAA